ncbi:MAG: hypothetical protein QXI58_01865 [Candidatus Micrarchaeia archaeon]
MNIDEKIMKNPDEWPLWPFLPVKRIINDKYQFGILVDGDPDYENTVILAQMHHHIRSLNDYDKLKYYPKLKYNSIDEILKDGWVVD